MTYNLPELQNENVSYIGMKPGFMIYNNWHYSPIPSFTNFQASIKFFIDLNSNFTKKASNKNKYIFLQMDALDGELPSLRDAKTKNNIISAYKTKIKYADRILLERKPNKQTAKYTLIPISKDIKFSLNEWIYLPDEKKNIWLEINSQKGILNRFVSFIYKPETYDIVLELSNNEVFTYRFWTGSAKAGFLIDPLILNDTDLTDFINNKKLEKKVIRFKIVAKNNKYLAINNFSIKFFNINFD
jgi:hypothetical protein